MAECCSVEEDPVSPQAPAPSTLPPPAFDRRLAPVQEFTVGFTCTFVEPPRELRTDCPICLYILREPHQATCCGTIYCKLCIERVKRDKKPCPTCRNSDFNVFLDRSLKNSLYGFKVWCLHREAGCTWSGELRYMEDHLRTNPRPEERFFGCEYVKLPCALCSQEFSRINLETHEMKKCPRRQYTCEYCSEHTAPFEEVAEQHWPLCPLRQTPCLNNCGVYPLRKDLDRHLKYECAEREPEPDLTTPEGMRKCVENVISERLPALAADLIKSTLREEIAKELEVAGELREAVQSLALVRAETQKLRDELTELRRGLEQDRTRLGVLTSHFSLVPVRFTLDDYKARHARRDMGWTSPPFYTHPRGYRMCLLVDVGGPSGQPKGMYMSVYLNLVRGEYDTYLKWPFRGSVTISMLSEKGAESHHVEVIKYHDSTPVATSGRVFMDEKMSKPWGKGKFVKHDELEAGGFVVKDALQFEISKVELEI